MTSRAAFRTLIGMGVLLLGLASAVLGYLGVPGAHVSAATTIDVCVHMLSQLAVAGGHAATPVETALVLVLSSMLLAGLGAAIHTTWITRTTVARLSRQQLELSPELAMLVGELGLAGRVALSDSPELFSYCVGFVRPTIHISAGMVEALDEDALRAVLVHERYHLYQRDPMRAGVAIVLAAAAFPFPIASSLRRAHVISREIEADRDAIAVAGRTALARALLTVMQHPRTITLSPVAAIGAFDPKACRVAHLTCPESNVLPRPTRHSLCISLLSFTLLGLLAVAAINQPVHARDAVSTTAVVPVSSEEDCQMEAEECEMTACPSWSLLGRMMHEDCEPAAGHVRVSSESNHSH